MKIGGLPLIEPDEIIRSNRRSLALVVDADGRLIARAPRHMPKSQIDAFVLEKQRWIQKKQSEARRYGASHPAFEIKPGAALDILGKRYVIEFYNNKRVGLNGETLFLPATDAQRALEAWLRQLARDVFERRLARWGAEMGLQYVKLRLSGAATRWGSCSAKDTISLNWRLVLCAPALVDYVVIHELAHIPNKNHGRAFWALVARYCPDFESRRRALREQRFLLDWFR